MQRWSVGSGLADSGSLLIEEALESLCVNRRRRWGASATHEFVNRLPQTTRCGALRLDLCLSEGFTLLSYARRLAVQEAAVAAALAILTAVGSTVAALLTRLEARSNLRTDRLAFRHSWSNHGSEGRRRQVMVR